MNRETLITLVENSYANNSFLYEYFQKEASLLEVIQFLYWDSLQPNFCDYIRRWLKNAPSDFKAHFEQHIEEERDHGRLFDEMMQALEKHVVVDKSVNMEVLDKVNYTFSPQCAKENSFGYFCGGFFATEMMAGKRYDQLIEGFDRHQIPHSEIEFIILHSKCEAVHSMQVMEDLVLPYIAMDENHITEVLEGINDRLSRSETFIKWYEKNQLKKS